MLGRPVGADQREHRGEGCGGGRHGDEFDLGAGDAGAGVDEAAEGGRLGGADRVEGAGAVVGDQPDHQPGEVAGVDHLHRLARVARHGDPAAAGGPPHPVGERAGPVVGAGHLPGPHDRGPGAVPRGDVVLAGDLQRAVRLLAQLLGVADRGAARGVLVGAGRDALAPVHRVAGDEQVPPDPVAEHVHRLTDMPRQIPADVGHSVPAALPQRRVVPAVPVPEQPGHAREQLRPGPAPAEEGHVGPGLQGGVDDGAAHERGAAEYEYAHGGRPYAGPAGRRATVTISRLAASSGPPAQSPYCASIS